jgi:hypothetical protein
MADEPTPAPFEDTPDDAPQVTPESQGTEQGQADTSDWESRYKDLQAEYTRASQENAQLNEFYAALQDPELGPQALQQLGYELDQADTEDPALQDEEGFYDPTDELWQEVEAIKARQAEEDQTVQEQQFMEQEFGYIDSEIAGLEQEHGRQLTEQEANTLGTLALQMRTDEGYPDVKGAYGALDGVLTERQKAYVEGKRQAARAPDGVPGIDKVNLLDPNQRKQAAARVMEAEADLEQ